MCLASRAFDRRTGKTVQPDTFGPAGRFRPCSLANSGTSPERALAQLVGRFGKRRTGVCTNRRNRGQTDDDDQRELVMKLVIVGATSGVLTGLLGFLLGWLVFG